MSDLLCHSSDPVSTPGSSRSVDVMFLIDRRPGMPVTLLKLLRCSVVGCWNRQFASRWLLMNFLT